MLGYIAEMTWKEPLSSEDIVEWCGFKKLQGNMRHRSLEWFGYVGREARVEC